MAKGRNMVYYAESKFYPIIGKSHEKIIAFIVKSIRHPILMTDNQLVPEISSFRLHLTATNDSDKDISIIDDSEHVLTLSLSTQTVQFSINYEPLAIECAQNGWLEVKQ
jgi:hypothetical protein